MLLCNQQIAFAIEKKKYQNWIGNFPSTIEGKFTWRSVYAGWNQNFASECVTFNIHLEILDEKLQ